jgi:MFS family permease
MLNRGAEQLLGRAVGPLQFRLVVMPTVVTLVAIRAGLRDARGGQPAFLWGIISDRGRRRRRMLAAWKDVARMFIVALVLDTVYQIMVLPAFSVVQSLIVAVACAIVPYVVFRSSTTLLARGFSRKQAGTTGVSKEDATGEGQDRQEKPGQTDE